MADPLVVQSLKEMRAEILGRIATYEAQIAQAKHDLAHVNATLRMFTEPEKQRGRYLVSHGFFRKGEIAVSCVGQLEVDGAMTTRELADRAMAAREVDVADVTLRNSVVFKVGVGAASREPFRLARMVQKRKGMCVWATEATVLLPTGWRQLETLLPIWIRICWTEQSFILFPKWAAAEDELAPDSRMSGLPGQILCHCIDLVIMASAREGQDLAQKSSSHEACSGSSTRPASSLWVWVYMRVILSPSGMIAIGRTCPRRADLESAGCQIPSPRSG